MISPHFFAQIVSKLLPFSLLAFFTSSLISPSPLVAIPKNSMYKDCRSLQKHFNDESKNLGKNLEFSGFENSALSPPFEEDGGIFVAHYPYCFGGYIIDNSPKRTYVCLGSIVDTSNSYYKEFIWTWGRYGIDHAWNSRKSEYCRWRN